MRHSLLLLLIACGASKKGSIVLDDNGRNPGFSLVVLDAPTELVRGTSAAVRLSMIRLVNEPVPITLETAIEGVTVMGAIDADDGVVSIALSRTAALGPQTLTLRGTNAGAIATVDVAITIKEESAIFTFDSFDPGSQKAIATLQLPAVATATRYTVRYATNAQLTGATGVTSAVSPITLQGLPVNTTFYASVVAETATDVSAPAYAHVLTCVPYQSLNDLLMDAPTGPPIYLAPGSYTVIPNEWDTAALQRSLIGDVAHKGAGAVKTQIVVLAEVLSVNGADVTGGDVKNCTFMTSTQAPEAIRMSATGDVTGNVIRGYEVGIKANVPIKIESNDIDDCEAAVMIGVGVDVGGGAFNSAGGNIFGCDPNMVAIYSPYMVEEVFAKNNAWRHVPPTYSTTLGADADLVASAGSTFVTTGATQAPCVP